MALFQEKSKKVLASGVLTLSFTAGLVTVGFLLTYTIQNDSGHTGLDPYHALAVFVPVSIIGLIHLAVVRPFGSAGWLAASAFVVGLFGVAFLVYLDRSNTLLQYEVWIDRGMPENRY